MKFLIDGSSTRLNERLAVAPELVAGQLLTPLTRYRRAHEVFGIDNGAFSGFKEAPFVTLLAREVHKKDSCLFVAVPDYVGSHEVTMAMWNAYNYLADGWVKAFVCQDGITEIPKEAGAVFIGGTNDFKDSDEALDIVKDALAKGMHTHCGRVNGPERFIRYAEIGTHTCDGSGVSRYDHMILKIQEAVK